MPKRVRWRGSLVFHRAMEGAVEIARWPALAGVLLAAVTLSAPLSVAQTQQQIDWCVKKDVPSDLAIDSCTAVIQSGRWSGKRLAWAFTDRCWAHFKKGENDQALADCNEAIRLDPKSAMAFSNRCGAHRNKG
ncbi:MAG: tetratricopeptide repeat protein, partial [Xanthobacteraceae bacterium]